MPLPPAVHAWVAPGSAALWHPAEPAAAAVLGSPWRPISVHPLATRVTLSWLFGLATLAALALPALRDRQWARGLVTGLVASGLAVASFGVVARVTFGSLLFGHIAVPTVSPFGPFVSKNHFASYVSAIALVSLGLAVGLADEARRDSAWLSWVRSPRAAATVVAFGATILLFLGVLVSQSRGGALGLLAGTLAFLMLRVSRRGRAATRSPAVVMAALVALVGAVGLVALLPDEARTRLGSIVGPLDSSGAFRLGLWRDSLAAFRASPGWGRGSARSGTRSRRARRRPGELRVEHAENDFVEVLVEGGWPPRPSWASVSSWSFALASRRANATAWAEAWPWGAPRPSRASRSTAWWTSPCAFPPSRPRRPWPPPVLAALGPREQEPVEPVRSPIPRGPCAPCSPEPSCSWPANSRSPARRPEPLPCPSCASSPGLAPGPLLPAPA